MMSSIDEIKARIDIVDLVSETVQLRHSGKNYLGFCPFHANTRTPAFVVFPESGTWRCFGQCNEGGDIFGFIMKKEGWDFGETLTFLADKAGVELKVPDTWEVMVRGAGVLGGYDDKTHPAPAVEGVKRPKLIIRGEAVFGGVSVRN